MKFTDLFNDVLPSLPGCGNDLAEYAIKQSIIDACRRSRVWKYWPDPQDVTVGEPEYDVDLPAGTDVAQIMSVRLDGRADPLTPLTVEQLDLTYPDWRTETGVIEAYAQIEPTRIRVVKIPDEALPAALAMTLALQPRLASTTFPDWIYTQFGDSLSAGALARLQRVPKKPWSDPTLAERNKRLFDNAVAAATGAAARGLTRAPIRTTSHH